MAFRKNILATQKERRVIPTYCWPSLLLLIYFRDGPDSRSHCTKVWQKIYSICDAPLSRSAWHGFAASQYGLILVAAQKLSGVVWTPIRCVTLHFRDRRSFAPLQKSRRHNRSCLWTKSPSGRIFEVAQKLSSIVWTPIRYVTLHFRDRRGAASLRHGNRAATTVLCANRSPIRYGFRGGAKAIRYSVNTYPMIM